LPVLYNPATDIIDNGFGILLKNSSASGCIEYSKLSFTYFLIPRHRLVVGVFLEIKCGPFADSNINFKRNL